VVGSVPVAWIITVSLADTANVFIVKDAELDPPSTKTWLGADANASLVVRDSTTPPAGALALRIAVPVAEDPPCTDSGPQETVTTDKGEDAVGYGTTLVLSMSQHWWGW
jgi:hypothetical protein